MAIIYLYIRQHVEADLKPKNAKYSTLKEIITNRNKLSKQI
jgi:hypothetical protein